MEEPELDEVPEGYISVKDKKSSKAKYWIGLFIVIVVSYTIKNYQREKVYETVTKAMPVMKSNFENLSPEESRKLKELRQEVLSLFAKYLTLEEWKDNSELMKKSANINLTQQEFDRCISYVDKVKSKCSPEEMVLLSEFEKMSIKLADLID